MLLAYLLVLDFYSYWTSKIIYMLHHTAYIQMYVHCKCTQYVWIISKYSRILHLSRCGCPVLYFSVVHLGSKNQRSWTEAELFAQWMFTTWSSVACSCAMRTAFYLYPSINSEMPAYYLNKEVSVSAHCQKIISKIGNTLTNIPYAEIPGGFCSFCFYKIIL